MVFFYPDPLKDPKNEAPEHDPTTTWGKIGIIGMFHALNLLGGLGGGVCASTNLKP